MVAIGELFYRDATAHREHKLLEGDRIFTNPQHDSETISDLCCYCLN